MKKIILLLIILISLPLFSLNAQASNNKYLEKLTNYTETINSFKNYSTKQKINGVLNFETDNPNTESPNKFLATYVLSINNKIFKSNNLIPNSKGTIKLTIVLHMLNTLKEESDINKMFIILDLDYKSLNKNLYFKINKANLSGSGSFVNEILSPLYLNQFNEFKKVFENKWIEVGEEYINQLSQSDVNTISELDTSNLSKQIHDGAIETLNNLEVKDAEETYKNILDQIETADLFRASTIKAGRLKGYKKLRLKRSSFISLIKDLRKNFKDMNNVDYIELNKIINKISLSFVKHENKKFDIMDYFAIRFRIKNMEELKKLSLNYSINIKQINKLRGSISKPSESILLEDLLNYYQK